MNTRQLVNEFVSAAEKNPNNRPDIFREAAYTFMGLAMDPKNVGTSRELSEIGKEFAGAAYRTQFSIDDFTDVLEETQQAYREAGNRDELDTISHRRIIHEQRQPPIPGHTSIAPASFTRDATLGRSAKIRFDPTPEEISNQIKQIQTVAFWQGDKKEAQAMTVDVNLVSEANFEPVEPPDTDPQPPVFSVRSFAEVTYGSDGNKTTVRCDIGRGKRMTVVGNYISVAVGCDFPGISDDGVTQNFTTPIEAGASIGPFAAPTAAPLILTRYIDNLEAGGLLGTASNFISIPAKAVLLLPILTDLQTMGAVLTVQFFNFGKVLIYEVTYTIGASPVAIPIPISGDASWVRVLNAAFNARTNIRLPFQLAM